MDIEEKRLLVSAIILGGMAANYHHNLIPATYWTAGAVELADSLIKTLSEKPSCTNNYQRENKVQ